VKEEPDERGCEMGFVSRGVQTPSNKSWSDTELAYVAQWAP